MPSGLRVLVIEDEADLRSLLSYNLEAWGYQVKAVESGQAGLKSFEERAPDLVLLDLMLPDISGIEVCRAIRHKQQDGPGPVILMLTARADEMDRVAGLEVGADDYLVKPFSVRELMLRMSARLRGRAAADSVAKAETPTPPERGALKERRRFSLGALEVDPDGCHVYVNDREVQVSALEMRLLIHLFQSHGYVLSRQQLLTEVWGYQPNVNSRTVDAHVKRLRDKLGPAAQLIETVRGFGYRLAEAGTSECDAGAAPTLDSGPPSTVIVTTELRLGCTVISSGRVERAV
jgi:two-component system phosphate regulon response regulator PhoB